MSNKSPATILKAKISKNNQFIQFNFKPVWSSKDGIRIYYKNEPRKYLAPVATTDMIKNKSRYYLTGLASEAKKSIYRIEVCFTFNYVPVVIIKV